MHLICIECGTVQEIPPLPDLGSIEEVEGFEVHQAHLELIGRCAACRKRRATQSKERNADG